jgi:hypothetical protein
VSGLQQLEKVKNILSEMNSIFGTIMESEASLEKFHRYKMARKPGA